MNNFALKRFSKSFAFVCSFVFALFLLFIFLISAALSDRYP